MERDAFHVSYLSYKIPEDAFHGQAVKTVAYLRVSTAQQTWAASASPSSSTHANTTSASTISSRRPPLDRLLKSVAFVAMKENIRIEGKRDIQTKVWASCPT